MKITVLTLALLTFMTCGTFRSGPSSQMRHYSLFTMQVVDESAYSQFKNRMNADLATLGGILLQEFDVEGAPRGPIKFGETNRALLLAFPSSNSLASFQTEARFRETRRLLAQAAGNIKEIGGYSRKPVDRTTGEAYVLKISNYKVADGKAQKIAAQINERIRKLYDFRETTTFVTNSVRGLARADDVGIFYYPDAQMQNRLYENKEIIQSIGEFNKSHLTGFVYLALQPVAAETY